MPPHARFGSWAVLGLLLAATLAGALTFDRRSWPGLVGDEATYLMQAQSLAWDFDVRYSRQDYDRFVAQWGAKPDGLILQSGDGGRTLVYAKPASYALWIAPFLRLSPTARRGDRQRPAPRPRRRPRGAHARAAPRPRRAALGGGLDLRLGRLRLRLLGPLRPLPDVPGGDRPGARLRRAARRRRARGDRRPRGPALARRRRSCSAWSSPPARSTAPCCCRRRSPCRASRRRLGIALLAAGAVARRPRLRPHPPGGGGLLDPLLRRAPELRRQDRLPRGRPAGREAGSSAASGGATAPGCRGRGRTRG